MKKLIVISDSFKGTLSSTEICDIARHSVPKLFPDCRVVTIPVADGGEGTVSCFVEAIGAEPVTVAVTGPFGEPVSAVYARKGTLAIIEMAAAAGLPMVGEHRDPAGTTTYGVGQIIRHAVENGAKEILLGIGGSCTNDGGCGCAAALGVTFTKADGSTFVPVGGSLKSIAVIDVSAAKALLTGVSITVMCDVENPLCGPTGCSAIFGPQKGATPAMVQELDEQMRYLGDLIAKQLGQHVAELPGAGAAGGLGAGAMAFLGGNLKSGIEAVLDTVDFDSQLTGADLVITGEGRIDSQSVHGKVISGIAKRTSSAKVPLVAIVGSIDPSAEEAYDLGVTAMFGIDREAKAFEVFKDNTPDLYRRTLEDVLRLIRAF